MPANLIVIILVLYNGVGVKGAEVRCDGFVNYNVDEGYTDDPMITDSRGAIGLNTEPDTIVCHVKKAGYEDQTFQFTVDEKHTRFQAHVRTRK